MNSLPSSLPLVNLPPLPLDRLPPLPPIENEVIRTQVFTHSSAHGGPKKALDFEHDSSDKLKDYEKLEHVGDSLLGGSLGR